jgi:integrase-like protein
LKSAVNVWVGSMGKAAAQRAALASGLDPIEAREQENRRKAIEAAKAVTFAQSAASYIESHKAGWRNAKHAEQWTNTLETYAGPVIGLLPFGTWAAERTDFPSEVCEIALAHTIANAAEAAYRRGDLFEKRKNLMNAWANFLDTKQRDDEALVHIRRKAA